MRIVVIGDEELAPGIRDMNMDTDAEIVFVDDTDAAIETVKNNFTDVLMVHGNLQKIHSISGILKEMPNPVLLVLMGNTQHYYMMGNNKLHISTNCHIPVKEEDTTGQDIDHYSSNF